MGSEAGVGVRCEKQRAQAVSSKPKSFKSKDVRPLISNSLATEIRHFQPYRPLRTLSFDVQSKRSDHADWCTKRPSAQLCLHVCVCVRVRPPFPREYSVNNMQGAIPLVIGGWPTKRPMTRAENVPARANEDIEGRNDKNK